MKEKYRKQQVNTVGLVAHYKLWAGLTSATTVFDYSLNGLIGTPAGTDIAPAYPGVSFNGNDDIISVASKPTVFSNISGLSHSVCTWANSDVGAGHGSTFERVFDTRIDDDNFAQINISNSPLAFQYIIEDGTVQRGVQADNVLVAGKWTFLTGTWNHATNTVKLYINGIEQSASHTNTTPSTGTTMVIGAREGGVNVTHFTGSIGEVTVFDRVLSIDDIKSIYEITRWRYQ